MYSTFYLDKTSSVINRCELYVTTLSLLKRHSKENASQAQLIKNKPHHTILQYSITET